VPRKCPLLILLLGVVAATAADEPRSVDGPRLLFTGDILLARQVKVELEHRNVSPWSGFAALFHDADWVGGNFEGAIGAESMCAVPQSRCFATPPSAIELLKDAGFRALTAENNHSGDLGSAGREQTNAAFQQAGLMALDFDASPQFFRVGDATVGLISITTVRAADGRVQEVPSVGVAQKLRLAHQLANVVVVSIHWGSELLDWPNEAQHRQARWLVEHGADLILGHHPHVVQSPECVEGKPVFFSLGNHVFDQKYPETKEGMIADCHLSGGALRCRSILTHTQPATSIPVLEGNDKSADATLATCTPKIRSGLIVDGYTIRPESWTANQPSDGLVLGGWKNGNRVWQSRRQRVVSLQVTRFARPDNPPMLFTLERHPSSLDREVGIRPYVYGFGPHGLVAKWRGTALAWPLIDAVVDDEGRVCALHRGDSFLAPAPETATIRIAAYRWSGFGFGGAETGAAATQCRKALK
jgi:poly-gamma-glutamate synthesis protein (capsule biosynthesis protein)